MKLIRFSTVNQPDLPKLGFLLNNQVAEIHASSDGSAIYPGDMAGLIKLSIEKKMDMLS